MSIEILVVAFAIISGLLILALMNYETKKERYFRKWIAGFIGIVIAFLAWEIYEAFLFEEPESFLAMLFILILWIAVLRINIRKINALTSKI